METGTADLYVKIINDSISVTARIITAKGKIVLSATFPNKPSEIKNFESTRICATGNPNSFFTGPESYKPVNIASIQMSSEGTNWISQFNLPAKPDRIWLATDFTWDFTFGRN